ncbi:phosphoribosyltransferase family protein [Campylobacter sp. 9BO]|uniref:ComF family protein n=1 Tax=Campylobacter sp. 9BO TaxID=3424759 RepID=UPI003D338642
MRCFGCECFSLAFICNQCATNFQDFDLSFRQVSGLKVYTFYDYSDIKRFIHAKHKMQGGFALKHLAKLSFAKFASEFNPNFTLNAIPIDDKNKSGYSHTAILAHALRSKFIKPIFGALRATSSVSYSGKDLKFRQENPRNFKLLKRPAHPVILVDDIITTGTTLLEARDTLQKVGCEVAFGLVLADARY